MRRLPRLWRSAWDVSPAITLLAVLNAVVLVTSLVMTLVDDTVLGGAPIWNKPIKFALSFLAFAPMLLWIYSQVRPRGRILRLCLEILGWSMIAEIVLIVLQAARGTSSHYNYDTPFDGAVFNAMAAGVSIFSVVTLVAGVYLARHRLDDSVLGLSVKIAVPVMLAGALTGYAMVGPKAGQLTEGTRIGSHTVGGPDGGPGLPLFGWSTEHGDGRVVHFVGLHALQVIPLVALGVAYLARRRYMSTRQQRLVVGLASVSYVGLMATTLVQAQRGQSVVSPDVATLALLVTLVAVPGAAAIIAASWCARRRHDDAIHLVLADASASAASGGVAGGG
jgi:hypothetical protein